MRIQKFETNGFGCLKGSYQFGSFPSTLIIEKNEQGKSTFVEGILAALYGLDENGSHGLDEKERFKPMKWEGFDVTLSIQIGEREYRIVRDFNTDSVGIWDEKTGQEVTSEFTKDNGQVMIGEGLLDLSRGGFLKTSLIRQHEIQALGETSHLAEKIEAMIDTLSGDATALQAVALLTEARDRCRNGVSVEREIDQLRQRLEGYQKDWERLEKERVLLDEKVARLLGLNQRWEDLRQSLDQMHYGAILLEKDALEGKVSHYEEKKTNLERLQSELESLKDISSFPSDQEKDLTDAVKAIAVIDKRIDKLKADRQETRKTIEGASKRIKLEFETIKSLTEEDLSEICNLMKTLQKDMRALREIRGAYDTEKKLIIQEGYPLKEYPDLKKTVGRITDEEKSNLVRCRGDFRIKKNEIRSLKRDILMHENKAEKTETELKGTRKSKNRAILSGGFLVLLAGVTYTLETGSYRGILAAFPIDWLMLQATLGALGLLVVLWGAIKGYRRRKGKMQALSNNLRRLETLLEKKKKMEKHQQEQLAWMEKLAFRLRVSSLEELDEKLDRFERLEKRTSHLRTIASRLKESKSHIAGNRSKLAGYVNKVGEKPGGPSWADMVHFYDKVQAYREIRSERRRAQDKLKALEKRFREADGEKKEKRELVASILNKSQIVWDGEGDKAIRAFKEKLHRFHQLVKIRDELIPQAQIDQIPEETYQSIVSNLKAVEASMMEIERKYPGIKREATQIPASSDDRVAEKEGEMERISEERQGLRNEITYFLDHYRTDMAKLEREMEICRRDLEKAEFFEEATNLAVQHLESVRREQHQRWAEFLNQKANTVLSHLNPDCESIDVKPDLSFSIHHRGLETTLDQIHVDGLLSVGARDQIYLALRLAISQYLSASGIHLPFILDDALMTSDDDRFAETMNFILKELTKTHQVIILTCHKNRHQWWLDHMPKLYKDRIQISKLQHQTSPHQMETE